MSLFKYYTHERIDVLEHGRIRFTPANAFNDPFECLPDSRLVEHPAWQRQNESDVVAELMVDETLHSVVAGTPMRWNETLIRSAHCESYRRRLPELQRLALSELSRGREPFRILCLSQVPPAAPEAILLWGHYTGDHQGIVIEFDPNHEWITSHAPGRGRPCDCGPVSYANRRVSWNVDEQGHAEPQRDFVFTKSAHWTHEQEYRLVRLAGSEGLDHQHVDSLVSLTPRAVLSVTIGIRASDATITRLRAATRAPAWNHVRLLRTSIHHDHFALTISDL